MSSSALHRAVMGVVDVLVQINPPPNSPEGRLLVQLTDACNNYVRERTDPAAERSKLQ